MAGTSTILPSPLPTTRRQRAGRKMCEVSCGALATTSPPPTSRDSLMVSSIWSRTPTGLGRVTAQHCARLLACTGARLGGLEPASAFSCRAAHSGVSGTFQTVSPPSALPRSRNFSQRPSRLKMTYLKAGGQLREEWESASGRKMAKSSGLGRREGWY